MIQIDYHMHSNYSGDSDATMPEMIEGAISKGLKYISFTQHNDPNYPYIPEEEGAFDLNAAKYLAEAEKLFPKYESKISICKGVEIGLMPDTLSYCDKFIKDYPFEFVIASSHTAGGLDPYQPSYYDNMSVKEGFTLYFEEILHNVNNFNNYDVYGHLDYVCRYADIGDKDLNVDEYKDIFEAILKRIIETGHGIEINTGGLNSLRKRPNPHKDILKMYKNMGGEIITIGADAHAPERIAFGFDAAEELLKECGFEYYTYFINRKPNFIKI